MVSSIKAFLVIVVKLTFAEVQLLIKVSINLYFVTYVVLKRDFIMFTLRTVDTKPKRITAG